MTFPYTGSNGLFTRLGKIAGMLNNINSFIGTGTLGPEFDALAGEYAAPDLNLIGGLYTARDSYRGVHGSMQNYLQALAQATLIQMVNEYLVSLGNAALPVQNLTNALTWLTAQMKTDAQTVAQPTVGETVTAGSSNTGTGQLFVSNVNALGIQHDYPFAETIKALCTKDGQSGGTAGQETFTITSPLAESNPLQWDWPLGSGVNFTQNAVDPTVSNSGGNLLTNSAWTTWTNPSVGPDNWLVLSGTVGTDILESSGGGAYKGNNGLSFTGTNTPALSQPFNTATSTSGNSGGTPGKLSALTQYGLVFWMKTSGTFTGGVLDVELTDGNNNILSDANSVQNQKQLSYTSFPGGTWTPFGFFFRTPAVIPSTGFRLRVRISTALAGTGTPTLYLGSLGMMAAPNFYAGGPRFALFSGASNFIQGDSFGAAITNNRVASAKWQTSGDQLFGMKALGLQFPSGGSPTILDSLIS